MDRYDHAKEMGHNVIRIESANRYKIDELGPLQIETTLTSQWLTNLKRHRLNWEKHDFLKDICQFLKNYIMLRISLR